VARKRTEKLYTLSEVAEKTGISLASLRRYRTLYPDRVPSLGEGRRQRFPAAALPVFRELKTEGMARRGRGRSTSSRDAAKAGVPSGAGRRRRATQRGAAARRARGRRQGRARRGAAPAARATSRDDLLTLVEIGRRTGISYPTLLRYVRLYLDRLPHTGSGRKRRFRAAAVPEFQKLRLESRRGRRAGGRSAVAGPSVTRQLAKLERGQHALARQIRDLQKALARPVRIRIER
jgi:DNA-binding transcriptional MerR regulator